MVRPLARFVLLACLCVLPRVAHARCATPRAYAELVTPLTSPLPLGAHLVVAVRSGFHDGGPTVTPAPDGDGMVVSGLALVRGDARIALTSEVIGGGLVRMIPERPLTEGTYALVGFTRTSPNGQVEQAPREVVVRGALPPGPSAIALTSARVTRAGATTTRWGERVEYRGAFRLERALPTGLVAALLTTSSGAVVVEGRAGARELVVSGAYGGSHCGDGHVAGVVRPEAGQRMRLVLVDVYGRVARSEREVGVE